MLNPTSQKPPPGPWTIYSHGITADGRKFFTIVAGSNREQDGPAEIVATIFALDREFAEIFCRAAPRPTPAPTQPLTDEASALVKEWSAFLARMLEYAESGQAVSVEDVSRLKALAGWADTPIPQTWNGTLNKHEARRAVDDARKRLQC